MTRKIIIIFALIVSGFSFAQDKPDLRVVGETWKGVTNADGTGTYFEIVKAALGDKYNLKIQVTSWTRATHLVKTGQADVLVGSYADGSDNLAFSEQHIDIEYPLYVVYNPDKFVPKSVDDLAGKLIAGRKGWGLQQYLPKSTQFYGVDSVKGISKLIAKDRVDGALTYSYNVLLADPTKQFSTLEVVPEKPLHIAFTNNEKGRELQSVFDNSMASLIEQGKLAQYFSSDMSYQHANLKIVNDSKMVQWNVIPKIFQRDTQSLDAVPWELSATDYLGKNLGDFEFKLNLNNSKKTKHNIETLDAHCAMGVRKPAKLSGNVIYSEAFHLYIEPRLFVVKNGSVEDEIKLLMQQSTLSLRELLDTYPNLNIAIQNNYNIHQKLDDILGEKFSHRIVAVPRSDYLNLINLLTQKRIDALIVWPSIISDINSITESTESLSSFGFTEKIASSLTTFIACHHDSIGEAVINNINRLLLNVNHQKAIYFPFVKKLDKDTAQEYKNRLKLEF